jgi:hypothetical protein
VTRNWRTVALGIVAVCAVVAAATATLINHRSSGESKQRKAVSAYVTAVNDIQNAMNRQLTIVRFAYRDLGAQSPRRKRAPQELSQAARTLSSLDRRLVAMAAPPEAAKLRSLLIRLVGEQAALTREVEELAVFTPRFGVLVGRLRASSARFDRAMSGIRQPARPSLRGTKAEIAAAVRAFTVRQNAAAAAEATAIDAYVADLRGLLRRLHALGPPAVVAPAYRAEVRSLGDVVTTGVALSTELRTPNRTRVSARIRAFTIAGREAGTLAVQRAQVAAIKAFNRRSRAVGTTETAVQNELDRLARVLP